MIKIMDWKMVKPLLSIRTFLNILTIIWFLTSAFDAIAQKGINENGFLDKANDAGLIISLPTEGKYKEVNQSVPFYPIDYAIKVKGSDLELYFRFIPADKVSNKVFPHVEATIAASSAATNEQSSVMSVVKMDEKSLNNSFHADWGREFYFQTKEGFSDKKNCRMIAIYREDKGLAIMFQLFNHPGQQLEQFYNCLYFSD